ncbi:MAG: zf-HC2 domain-containing protein [Planctomycetes bacterium]|nr:zf-HC2 domain-containing protein [Planctomycetota bacterium]
MNPCERILSLLSAYLDREVDASARTEVDRHLSDCAQCRDEYEALVTIRLATERMHADLIAAAPPMPDAVRRRLRDAPGTMTEPMNDRPATENRRNLMRALTGIGLTAAAALIAILFWPSTPARATPNELLRRASALLLRHDNHEFLVTPDSDAIELLKKIFDGGAKKEKEEEREGDRDPGRFRLIVAAPNRFLADWDVRDDHVELGDGLLAFDGKECWTYDADRHAIQLLEPPTLDARKIELESGEIDLANADLMTFLSWGFIREMNEIGREDGSVLELTGPYEERIGHRVFEFDVRRLRDPSVAARDEQILEMRVRVTIDTRTELIERAVFELRLGGLSLLRLDAQLVRVDQVLPEGFFRYSTYARPDTEVLPIER